MRVGDVLGVYRVERLVGGSGLRIVLQVRHLEDGSLFAMKVALPELDRAEVLKHWLRQAKLWSVLRSPHLVRIHMVDSLPDGTPFMLRELLEGEDLGETLRARGPLGLDAAISYFVQTCVVLDEIHAMGVCHANLKPANLFLARHPDNATTLKVLGSWCRYQGEKLSDDPKRVAFVGTPPYMSPQRMLDSPRAEALDDVWSLGCVMYRLLTGELPFKRDGQIAIAEVIARREPVAPRKLRPEIPQGLEEVILRCLRKDPSQRFQSMSELGEALRPWHHGSK